MSSNRHHELRSEVTEHLEVAKRKMAVVFALQDGVLTEEQAKEYLNLDDELQRIQSDYYPGDEYYDKAMLALEREL